MYFLIIVLVVVLAWYIKKNHGITKCSNCGSIIPKEVWNKNRGCPECNCREQVRVPLFGKLGFPRWFNLINLYALLPIILWPGVVIATIMLSDSGKQIGIVTTLIILAVVYPILIISIRYISYYLYNKNKIIAIALPLIPVSLLLMLLLAIIYQWAHLVFGKQTF